MSDRREKIAALLHSPVAGEREAAQAALDRVRPIAPPMAGTKEWESARAEWWARVMFCMKHLGSPGLTQGEVLTVKNAEHWRAGPWAVGNEAFEAVYRKLLTATEPALLHQTAQLTDKR